MYRIAVAALIVAASGCATAGGASGGRSGNAGVSGIVRLPQSGLQGNPCDSLRVQVTATGSPAELGDAMLKLSNSRGQNRCSYTVSGLPTGTDLQIGVTAGSDLKCASGEAPTVSSVSSTPTPLKLGDYQTATRDFQLTCGA
jgi:hypothetical protein